MRFVSEKGEFGKQPTNQKRNQATSPTLEAKHTLY